MEDCLLALDQVFARYRQDLEDYRKKSSPMDGLLGFGHPLGRDYCHDRLDEGIAGIVQEMGRDMPGQEKVEAVVRRLLMHDAREWPDAAEWMLRAAERHTLPLIPFLSAEAARALCVEYAARYRPWDRLPAQKEVYKALKARC